MFSKKKYEEKGMMRWILILTIGLLLVATSSIAGPEKVAFPSDYKNYLFYTTVDRPDNKTMRDIYISRESAKMVKGGWPLPNGTVMVMEVYKAKADEKDELLKDANGRLIKSDMVGIFVMEKRTGWGSEYGDNIRNGEWEYARFTPDGKPHQPADTKACFECHKPKSAHDYVFTFPQLLEAPK